MATFRTLEHPNSIFWEITDKCNHNCVHCFNYWRSDTQRSMPCAKPMSKKHMEQILNKIIALEPVKVVLTGGEPLAAWDQTKAIIQKLRKAGIGISMNTNAALATEAIADVLVKNRIPLFISFPSAIEAEFDEITDTPGAYRRVLAAMELLQSKGVRFSVNMVVSRVNLNSIFDTAKLMQDRFGMRTITITRVSEPINARDKFCPYLLARQELEQYAAHCVRVNKELGMQVRASSPVTPCSLSDPEALSLFGLQGGCEAGRTSFVISASGMVRACARDFTEYGNILEEEFHTLWARMQPWREEAMIPAECADCTHRALCRGGCRIDGLVKTGKHTCLDLYSDVNNTHPEFKKAEDPLPAWGLHKAFKPAPDLKLVKEEFGIRVSARHNSVFCTEDFAQYLSQIKRFTVAQFCKEFDVDINRAVQVIFTLRKKYLVLDDD